MDPSDSSVFERRLLRGDCHNNHSRVILFTRTTSVMSRLAEARGKIKMKGNGMKQSRALPFSVSNHLSRPPEPPSAFLNTRILLLFLAFSLFISLALGSLVAHETSRTKNKGRETRSTEGQHRDWMNSNYLQLRNRDSSGFSGHGLGHNHHSANRQQREQNQQEQNQLRYLIARTATMPQLIGRDFYKSSPHPLEQQYRPSGHHNKNHMDNKIVSYYHKRDMHPKPVQRAANERSLSVAQNRREQHRKPTAGTTFIAGDDLERSRFGHYNRFGYDFDSLDVASSDLDDDDDGNNQIEGSLDDVDDDDDDVVEDIDNDAGDNRVNDDDADDEDDTAMVGTQTEATEESNSISDSDGDSHDDEDEDDDDEQNSIQLERTTNNRFPKKNGKQANTLYTHSTSATGEAKSLRRNSNHLSKVNTNVTALGRLAINNLKHQLNGALEQNLNWKREYESEAQAKSSRMVTSSPILGRLEMEESRERSSHHPRASKHESQPSAPYQSPVVVSISDNSFVSASPISVGTSSDEQVESLKRFEGVDAPHYSHIIASPKNELSLHGKRYWHQSHIQMIQEEPDELHRGNINSAIIAILFGIGVTGTLIMIVSIKMRSIRERVAYKGRRRSLVPDTDFLINTIPM